MCLRIEKDQKPQIATEPIICYKCLTEDMLSPCYNQKYELGKMLTSEFSINKKTYYYDKIEKGLHTFADESEAKCIAKDFSWFDRISHNYIKALVVIKCEIPVGATYYKARSLMPGVIFEYASNQLLPLEIISQ